MLLTGIAVPLRDSSLSRTSLFAPRPRSRSSSIAFRGALASRIFFLRATYVGQWKNDKKHGLGKYILASGEVAHDGEWENGNPKK